MEKELIIICFQIVLVFILIAVITYFLKLNNAIKLEKRVSKYTIKRFKGKEEKSFVDSLFDKYIHFVIKQRRKVGKLFPTITRKYDKYVTSDDTRAVDYVTHKLVLSCIFVILTFLSCIIQGKFITILQLIFSIILGFYILDIVLLIINRSRKKKIENDMLRAIIIMNNAFKSGKSTIQAVEIASNKLAKPISSEFKRIHQEMKYGLSVDVVFDRFAKRVNIEEAEYLSSSLIILNKTGGNIVAVFNSIERTLFDKMKLREELKNSTAVSNLVVKILLFVPIIFVFIIYLLNPNYFDPFFDSPLGYILIGFILLLFLTYAYLLQKIVKVDY